MQGSVLVFIYLSLSVSESLKKNCFVWCVIFQQFLRESTPNSVMEIIHALYNSVLIKDALKKTRIIIELFVKKLQCVGLFSSTGIILNKVKIHMVCHKHLNVNKVYAVRGNELSWFGSYLETDNNLLLMMLYIPWH